LTPLCAAQMSIAEAVGDGRHEPAGHDYHEANELLVQARGRHEHEQQRKAAEDYEYRLKFQEEIARGLMPPHLER
jgi:hypothetical protein